MHEDLPPYRVAFAQGTAVADAMNDMVAAGYDPEPPVYCGSIPVQHKQDRVLTAEAQQRVSIIPTFLVYGRLRPVQMRDVSIS